MSRHRLLQPENLELSQFRIRASKKDKRASNNYESISPIHLPISSQYLCNKMNMDTNKKIMGTNKNQRYSSIIVICMIFY